MATVKKSKPIKEVEKEPLDTMPEMPVAPEDQGVPQHEEPVRAKAKITILEPKPEIPQLPRQQKLAPGNVWLVHTKSGRKLSVSRSYATTMVRTSKDYIIQ